MAIKGNYPKLLKRRFWQLQESNSFYSLLMSLPSQWQSVDVFQQSLCEVILDPLWDYTGEPDGNNKSKIQGRRKSQPTAIVSLSVHCCNSSYVKKLGLVSWNFHHLRQQRLVCSQISKLQKQADHTTKDSLQPEV